MPTICRFRGIVITMYYNDHMPPHFHVEYAGQEAIVSIEELEPIYSHIPSNKLKTAIGWAACHQQELRENWELARAKSELYMISPSIE